MAANQLNWFSLQSRDTKPSLCWEDFPELQRRLCGQFNSKTTGKKNDSGSIPPLEDRLPTWVKPSGKGASEDKPVCAHQHPAVLSLFSAGTKVHERVCGADADWVKQRGKRMINSKPFLDKRYSGSFKELVNPLFRVLWWAHSSVMLQPSPTCRVQANSNIKENVVEREVF